MNEDLRKSILQTIKSYLSEALKDEIEKNLVTVMM